MIRSGAKPQRVLTMNGRRNKASAYAPIANYWGATLTTVQVAMCQHRGWSLAHTVIGVDAGYCIRANGISWFGGIMF